MSWYGDSMADTTGTLQAGKVREDVEGEREARKEKETTDL